MSNELDKHIGETLGWYESDVDAEALWIAVLCSLDKWLSNVC